jgi:hypothetical protein
MPRFATKVTVTLCDDRIDEDGDGNGGMRPRKEVVTMEEIDWVTQTE